MSEVYIKEPQTKGKAVLQTTHGDLEIELWATETPKACRNFCQLILEGYYNGTAFHRVIKDFCIQGGDGTGTGDGCESIYGSPYADEIHPRLKFRYRGMLGVASAGKGTKTNGSQFFITMGRIPSLDGKHTLFGKVVGQTIYNLVRINDVDVDRNDCPVDPPRIVRAELVWDPFGDLEPRYKVEAPAKAITSSQKSGEHRRAPVHKKNVLSFAEDNSDEDDDKPASKTKGKSAHDLLNDPKLSREGAYSAEVAAKRDTGEKRSAPTGGGGDAKRPAGTSRLGARGKPAQQKAREEEEEVDYGSDSDENESENEAPSAKLTVASRAEEIAKLKRDIVGLNSGLPKAEAKTKTGSLLEAMQAAYQKRGSRVVPRGKEARRREAEAVVDGLKSFQDRLKDLKDDSEEEEEEDDVSSKKKKEEAEHGFLASIWQEGDEEADKDWLGGKGLKFHTSGDKAFELAARKARDSLEIFDPIAARGNKEALANAIKRRNDKLVPSMRRQQPLEKW